MVRAAAKAPEERRMGRRGGAQGVNAAEFLVTGGTGTLGSRVVDRLRGAGHQVRVLSRSGRQGTIRGDLATGEGLETAVGGVETIVHCASSPTMTRRVDVEGTERLLGAASRAGVSHLLFISIVGVDRNPYFPYYGMKLETEKIIERAAVPWTILRITQFHGFVLRLIQTLDRLPVVPTPRDFLLQPIDVGEAAGRTAEYALLTPSGRVPEVGGPEVRTFADLARAYLKAAGRRRMVVEVPVPGKMARAFREGAQLAPEGRYGEIRWEQFLDREIRV
jgi:uncharacterized protein YbjT (DUF2867 family)